MTHLSASLVLARMNWLRLTRSKTIYVALVLAILPMLLALIRFEREPRAPWLLAVEIILRIVIPLPAAIHASGAVGDELEQKTFTYLWSRPIPRTSIVLGRVLLVTPLVAALGLVSVLLAYVAAPSVVTTDDLAGALKMVPLTALAFCMFAVGAGALVPRWAMLFTILIVLSVEQFLFAVPVMKYLSIVSHGRVVAGLEPEASVVGAVVGQLLVGLGWLALGLVRVTTAEHAAERE